MLALVEDDTALVLTANVAVVAPAAMATLEGTLAAAVLLLESMTCAPPAGAGPLKVTVPVEEFPPMTDVGFTAKEDKETAGGVELEEASNSRIAGFGSFRETTTNFEGEII
jgi:hypothetical protein